MTRTTVTTWDDVATYGDAKADRRLVAGEAGNLKRVMVKAGTVADRHAHPFEQFFLVQEGTGTLTHEDGEVALKPGVIVPFVKDAWHSAVFDTDTVLYEVNFR